MNTPHYIEKEVVWAKGRFKSEEQKYTSWSGGKCFSKLGGFSISTYKHNEFVGVTAHTSDGRSYGKYFQVPIDKIDEFCATLTEVKDFVLKNKSQNSKIKPKKQV